MDATAISSLVNLGAAGAVIICVVFFLKHMKAEADVSRAYFTELHKGDKDAIGQLTTALDRLTDMVSCMREELHEQRNELKSHDESVEQRIREIKGSTSPGQKRPRGSNAN